MVQALAILVLIVFVYMTCWYLFASWARNYSLVDIAWGLGFLLIAVFAYNATYMQAERNLVLLVMCLAWGLRLSSYLIIRNWGRGEDFRYQKMRDRWGASAWWKSYIYVFLLQGLLMLIVSTPLLIGNLVGGDATNPIQVSDVMGFILWGLGLIYEATADYQMLAFKSNPENKGRIMRYGLWAQSRHPNYFGETLVWWGIWVFSLGTTPWAVLGIIGPILITFLLVRVSGVPMLESEYKDNPEYQDYTANTPEFVPRFV